MNIERGGLRAVAEGDPNADLVVVLLHGYRMRPDDLAPFAHSLMVPGWYLFPEGPLPATPDGRAWWHIDDVARDASMAAGPRDFADRHPPDLPDARVRLHAFLDALEIGERRLVLGGFSQGGMLALDYLLRSERRVDGLALLSTSRIAFDEWQPILASDRLRDLRCLVAHGRADEDLAFDAGEALQRALSEAGAEVRWLPFDGGHEIPLPVWRALRKLLR